MPASSVSRVSSATDGTPSFIVIAVRCSFTVRSWMPRSSAICLFSLPCTTWPSTSSSRSLSASKRARRLTLPGALLAFALIAGEGTFHRIDQLFFRRALFQEILRTTAHRAHGRGDVASAGEEKGGQRIASPRECRLQIESVHFGHLQISHHTTRRIGIALREKVARRRKRLHRKPARPQEARGRSEKGRIVIDNVNGGCGYTHPAAASSAIGNVKRNAAPPPLLFSAQSRPPCASTIVREIGRPMPIPFGLVVKNGSKTCASLSAGMPWPVSLTAISTDCVPSSRAVTLTRRSCGLTPLSGVHAVEDEIEQHLLEMHAVAAH